MIQKNVNAPIWFKCTVQYSKLVHKIVTTKEGLLFYGSCSEQQARINAYFLVLLQSNWQKTTATAIDKFANRALPSFGMALAKL